MKEAWRGFKTGCWTNAINVREFVQENYTPYGGDDQFLSGATENTKALWQELCELTDIEQEKGIYDAETSKPASITTYGAGYIDQDKETIVGLQTDRPLKRAIMPQGGLRMVETGLKAYGYKLAPEVSEIFTKYRKCHNTGVFDVYNDEIRAARRSGIITGLPDAYGRGRIIGDYRRIALYGLDQLITDKLAEKETIGRDVMDEDAIRLREEFSEQIRALKETIEMGQTYGFDLSQPARNAKEAIQWTYMGFLASVKEQNGAAMSLGRVSTFLDVYIERDLAEGTLTEEQAQEMVDHFVMKLRIVRFLRTPAYDELFSGDPTWVTEAIGGVGNDGRSLVSKTSFRFLNTVYTLGPAPEPNMTVLWSESLPQNFKNFCAKVSIDTSTIQYENDDLMRGKFSDDYGIACCVSAMEIGKQMQFFGARCNLAKTLLYAINGGKDEKSGVQVAPAKEPVTSEYLDYDEVQAKFADMVDWLSKLYINTLNCIHYMHDKYAYERIQMALHETIVLRTMAGGIAGLSVVADAFSAMKYAKVKVIRNEEGLAVDFDIEGEFPTYGNNDDRVDTIACDLVAQFMGSLRSRKT